MSLSPFKLNLAPDQTGYSALFGNDQDTVTNEGAQGIYARNVFNNCILLNAQWICDADEYDYLSKCYRVSMNKGNMKFSIDLMLDDSTKLLTYNAKFVPDSFKLNSVQGETFTVVAQLEIEPIPYNVVNNPFVVDSGLSDRRVIAATGRFLLTGFSTERVKPPRVLSAVYGTFVLSGQNAGFDHDKVFTAAKGQFTLTGIAATLTYFPLFVSYPELSREWGRYTWLTGVESNDINTLAQVIEREWMRI